MPAEYLRPKKQLQVGCRAFLKGITGSHLVLYWRLPAPLHECTASHVACSERLAARFTVSRSLEKSNGL